MCIRSDNSDARYSHGAQGADTEHLQSGSLQTAKYHRRKPGVASGDTILVCGTRHLTREPSTRLWCSPEHAWSFWTQGLQFDDPPVLTAGGRAAGFGLHRRLAALSDLRPPRQCPGGPGSRLSLDHRWRSTVAPLVDLGVATLALMNDRSRMEQLELPPAAESVCELREELIEFVVDESSKVRQRERLPGTTEVLDSYFGKLKALEDGQSKSGFTGLVHSLGATVSNWTKDSIHQALERCGVQDVLDWCRKNLGTRCNRSTAGRMLR
jgi:hypothetical protein